MEINKFHINARIWMNYKGQYMEGAETEWRMHVVWVYVHEKQNMQRDSIISKVMTVGK